MIDFVYGEPSWELSGDLVQGWVSCHAGHVAPIEFRLGVRIVSPYALAPWKPEEADASLPPLLKVLRGDFFCFPFGPQKDGLPHGTSANANWSLVSQGEGLLHLELNDPDSGGRLEKLLTLPAGETALYGEHRISGVEGLYSYGNHPILDLSTFPEGQGRISVSPFRWASIYPGLFSDPANHEHGTLQPAGRFTDLREVPLMDGGTTDLTRYPARLGNDDLVMMAAQPATDEQPFAWSAATLDGYVWFSLKNPADFPTTLLWVSNGGRLAAPWDGRHVGRLGIEEVCSHFSDGVDVSRTDPLAADGIVTSRPFRNDQPFSLRIVQAVVAVPPEFGCVVSIRPAGPGKVILHGEVGPVVCAAVGWQFVL